MAENNTKRDRLLIELTSIERRLRKLYGDTYRAAVEIKAVRKAIEEGQEFTWDGNPAAAKQLQSLLDTMGQQTNAYLRNATSKAWTEGEEGVHNTLAAVFATNTKSEEEIERITEKAREDMRKRGASGHNYFNEKRGGLTISDRVWNISDTARNEIETIIQNGILEGKNPDQIAKSVQPYLREPNKLFRRVRNKETGELELSQAAKKYKPGRGVYRSAYKNAMRLARTEVTAAYRRAEWETYQNNPLITGFRIELSNNHTTLVKGVPVPFHDICDDMVGVYPKTFLWTGWHPQCRCRMIPVFITKADFKDRMKALAAGKLKNWKPKSTTTDMPENFKKWIQDNSDRIAAARALPYWMQDNQPIMRRIINAEIRTPEDQLIHELDAIEGALMTAEEILNLPETIAKLDELGIDPEEWIERHIATEKDYKGDLYYRVDGRSGAGYAGVGNGLYLGRNKTKLDNFYNPEGDGQILTFKGKPRWLNILDPRREAAWNRYLQAKGIDPVNSGEIGELVKALGYDGIRYFDPFATGDEYVLFNTSKMKNLATGAAAAKPFILDRKKVTELKNKGWRVNFGDDTDSITEKEMVELYKKIMGEFDLQEYGNEIEEALNKQGIKITDKVFALRSKTAQIMQISSDGTTAIHRGIHYDPSTGQRNVSHQILKIKEELQGKGLSRELLKVMYKQYKKAGVKEIVLTANMEVGGYAWAKYGFHVPKDEIDLVTVSRNVKGFQQITDKYFRENPTAESFPMRIIADMPGGKEMLLGSDWDGFLDLTDRAAVQTFENYLFNRR